MNRNEILDVVLILLILTLLGVIGYGLVYVDKNQIQCLDNPIVYYEHMKNVSCDCKQYNPYEITGIELGEGEVVRIKFDEANIWEEESENVN